MYAATKRKKAGIGGILAGGWVVAAVLLAGTAAADTPVGTRILPKVTVGTAVAEAAPADEQAVADERPELPVIDDIGSAADPFAAGREREQPAR